MNSIFDEIYDFVLEQSTATRQQIIAELADFDEVEVIKELNRIKRSLSFEPDIIEAWPEDHLGNLLEPKPGRNDG